MTNEEKLQDYEAKLEIVKRHFDVDYKYLNLIGFEIELEKFVNKVNNVEKFEKKAEDFENEVIMLKNEVSNLENNNWIATGIKKLKKKFKK